MNSRKLLIVALIIGWIFYSNLAFAKTAYDDCKLHKETESPGTCEVAGSGTCQDCDCAIYIDNLALKECYKYVPGGREKNKDCIDCPSNDACEQP